MIIRMLALLLWSAVLTLVQAQAQVPAGENFKTLAQDGAWCWFSDPRAVYHEGVWKKTYGGWVNHQGDIVLASYNHISGRIDTTVLHEKLQADDHANPSLLVAQDGRLLVFYSKHSAANAPIWMRVSVHPEDIRTWEPPRPLWLNHNPAYDRDWRRDYCYTNPCQLSAEEGKLYLFWRGINFKPCVSVSSDGGQNWEMGRILIMPEETYKDRRPYVKYCDNGRDRIHMAFTDGHPIPEANNSIYYMCYRDAGLYRAGGKKMAEWANLPVRPEQADKVYDAAKSGVRAWVWDIAEDHQGRPVIVYSRLVSEQDHRYHYAAWDGKKWLDAEICPAGSWFPKTPANEKEREPYYSGGVVLDHNDPAVVYLSRPHNGVFEIEKWTTQNQGKTWTVIPVTQNSQNDNVRPFVIRRHSANGPAVVWMNNNRYVHYTDYFSTIRMDIPLTPFSPAVRTTDITRVMAAAADWQLRHPSRHALYDWTSGALFTGLAAWAQMSDEPAYVDALVAWAKSIDWQLGPRTYHADDHTVGYLYQELYRLYRDLAMMAPLQKGLDYILSHPSSVTLKRTEQKGMDRWWWCDALFMSPPVWARMSLITGDKKYIDFMNKEWWLTTDYLYDKEERLYFRDDSYFDKREANGKKIFWSRGNGWVIAGIVRVLQNMPQDYPDRIKYVRLYQEMAAKLLAIQPADGLWRPSLLDPDSYPNVETSGSGFFTYSLAWGINNGLLDRSLYLPAVQKAWAALVRCVHPNGMLGNVQPIGADPKQVSADMTEIYGVGAFLLAGHEMYKIALFSDAPKTVVTVTNSWTGFRNQETVELDWSGLQTPGLTADNAAVFDVQTNRFLLTQTMVNDQTKPCTLLFQSDWAPNECKTFWVVTGQKLEPAQATFGMYVPQRKDDFAWESDRIAFRMYGKALEDETVSSGVDVWVKSVRYPILEKWYRLNDYHNDHGEGLDFYKVGPTRGCGGLAVVADGQVYGSRNYRMQKLIANGPIRTVFELGYDPWQAGHGTVTESKRISIDLGSNLSRFESRFTAAKQDGELELAMGIVKIQNEGEMVYNLKKGWLAYYPPMDPVNGAISCGVATGPIAGLRFADQDNHGLLLARADASRPWVYYAGAGWSRSGDFPTRESWLLYMENFSERLAHPLQVQVRE